MYGGRNGLSPLVFIHLKNVWLNIPAVHYPVKLAPAVIGGGMGMGREVC